MIVLIQEYQFHPTRKWRLDFAIPELKIAIEIEGRGRHQTIKGVRNDLEKYNTAVEMGWKLFRHPATDIRQNNEYGEKLIDLFVEQVCRVVLNIKEHDDATL